MDLNFGLKKTTKIHIRIQQRNKRQSVTVIENINPTLNLIKILATLKSKMHCNPTQHSALCVVMLWWINIKSPKGAFYCGGHVIDENIILQGDWRNDVAEKNDIVVHGF